MNLVVLLNMADEAKKYGITIDAQKRCPSCWACRFSSSAANTAPGYPEALQAITKALRYPTPGMAEQLRQPVGAGRAYRSGNARVLKHAVQIPAQLPENLTEKLDRVMPASVAGPADLLRHHVPAVPGHVSARPTAANRYRRAIHLDARGRACAAAGRVAASRARTVAGRHLQWRCHRRRLRAAHRAVLSVHGDGGRQRLPVARRISDGRADGASGAGRARLRDAADGLRLQRARADGHPRDALARDAPAHHAGDPVLAVLGAFAGVRLHHRRAVLAQSRAGRIVQPCTCSASPPRSSPRCCSKANSKTANRSCWNCRPTASPPLTRS